MRLILLLEFRHREHTIVQQIRERGDARVHECLSMDVDEPCDKVQLVLPKAECTS